jgi:hypothetical protein
VSWQALFGPLSERQGREGQEPGGLRYCMRRSPVTMEGTVRHRKIRGTGSTRMYNKKKRKPGDVGAERHPIRGSQEPSNFQVVQARVAANRLGIPGSPGAGCKRGRRHLLGPSADVKPAENGAQLCSRQPQTWAECTLDTWIPIRSARSGRVGRGIKYGGWF